MKNLCLMLCLLCIWLTSSLQANPDPWQHLSSRQQADTLRSIIRKLDTNNLDSIITLSGQLQQIAGELKDDKEVAYSIGQMAWAYKHKNDLGQSIRYYFQLKRLYQQLEDNAGLGTACFNIGQIYAKAREYDQALMYQKLAIDHYQTADQPYKISVTLYEMAIRYIEKGEPDTATDLLFQALNKCPGNKVSHISMINNRLGQATKDLGNHVRAREYYRESLSGLDDSPKWDKKRAIANHNIAESYYLERQQYDSAVFYLEKALTIKQTLNDPDFTLSTLTLLGKLAHQSGQFPEAFQWLDRGISQVDPAKLSKNVDEALALVTLIANDPALKKPLPHAELASYMNIQQQQFLALQGLKDELDRSSMRYHVQIGVDQDVHEQETKTLEASVTNRTFTLGGLSAIFLVLAGIGLVYAKMERREKQHVLQDKDAFVTEQVKNYDEKILRMLIMKAGYEEIKDKLKRDFGLDDDDFGGS